MRRRKRSLAVSDNRKGRASFSAAKMSLYTWNKRAENVISEEASRCVPVPDICERGLGVEFFLSLFFLPFLSVLIYRIVSLSINLCTWLSVDVPAYMSVCLSVCASAYIGWSILVSINLFMYPLKSVKNMSNVFIISEWASECKSRREELGKEYISRITEMFNKKRENVRERNEK